MPSLRVENPPCFYLAYMILVVCTVYLIHAGVLYAKWMYCWLWTSFLSTTSREGVHDVLLFLGGLGVLGPWGLGAVVVVPDRWGFSAGCITHAGRYCGLTRAGSIIHHPSPIFGRPWCPFPNFLFCRALLGFLHGSTLLEEKPAGWLNDRWFLF